MASVYNFSFIGNLLDDTFAIFFFFVLKIVEKYIKDARSLIATQDQREIVSALNLLDAALAISPRLDQALELRARALLCLRRFKEVADMLQDYIPSLRINDDSSSSSSSSVSSDTSREGVKLLSSCESPVRDQSFKCFSVSDLKKKVMAGLCKNCEKEGQWRYFIISFYFLSLTLLHYFVSLVLLCRGVFAGFKKGISSFKGTHFVYLFN